MAEFTYQEIFEHGHDTTAYRKLTADYVSTSTFEGQEVLKVAAPEALTLLAREAMDDVAHLLRPGHLQQLSPTFSTIRRPRTTIALWRWNC